MGAAAVDVPAAARSNSRREPLTSIDLFCGAGGITEGFRQAGYTCLYGNDASPTAIQTFAHNHPEAWPDPRPIEQVSPASVRRKLGLARGELSVLAGGAPCQGFSINAPERFLDDPRNILFRHYVRFVREFKPQSLLFENVPGMLSLGGGAVFARILRELEDCGYSVAAHILFAAHYGVPQERWRLIILGSRRPSRRADVALPIEHPRPTHYAVARANFRGGRTMTFRLTPDDEVDLLPAVTVGDAIGDLPRLGIGEGSDPMEYDRKAKSEYAKSMRKGRRLYNHVAGQLSRQNLERLRHIKPGGSWRDIPHELLPKGMKRARKSDHTRRYGRLRQEGLAGTVMTKCDPHWGSVFLPDQDRTLTVREAARLQSFPDGYRFLGTRVTQYEQVGNAVPPLMASAIAEALVPHAARATAAVASARGVTHR
jgi:DNA (cytosine-5)-methyltransferase 1